MPHRLISLNRIWNAKNPPPLECRISRMILMHAMITVPKLSDTKNQISIMSEQYIAYGQQPSANRQLNLFHFFFLAPNQSLDRSNLIAQDIFFPDKRSPNIIRRRNCHSKFFYRNFMVFFTIFRPDMK